MPVRKTRSTKRHEAERLVTVVNRFYKTCKTDIFKNPIKIISSSMVTYIVQICRLKIVIMF